jgi:hypothetical protein
LLLLVVAVQALQSQPAVVLALQVLVLLEMAALLLAHLAAAVAVAVEHLSTSTVQPTVACLRLLVATVAQEAVAL